MPLKNPTSALSAASVLKKMEHFANMSKDIHGKSRFIASSVGSPFPRKVTFNNMLKNTGEKSLLSAHIVSSISATDQIFADMLPPFTRM
ncbi:hypothetical protein pdam_00010180 [Pocillopora damicornis]|uniref:Uncharacterized protein n=1 Tax=Pocillopora damicornis TaxID=46731 RepID=A0A3M6T4D8_POCDA|nr:hypothetical protein pdam_00010180 [Pocillopora damicornis]